MIELDYPPRMLRGAGELVLYLDFDGVLHHENVLWHPKKGAYLCAPSRYTLFQHADLLAELLEPFPDVKIVLSTAWVRSYGCDHTAKRLPSALRKRVIGATFHSRMDESTFVGIARGQQIWRDVVRRNPKDWLALDDEHEGWPPWCLSHYVRTHMHEGISDPPVLAKIEEKLANLGASDAS
ncbi:MAG: HAD domain-containing protein [Pseudomonadota bacterium]